MTLDPEYLDFVRNTTYEYLNLYAKDPKQGRIALISAFIAPLGAIAVEDRSRIVMAICSLAQDIGNERFEDGQDYVDYLKGILKDRLEP